MIEQHKRLIDDSLYGLGTVLIGVSTTIVLAILIGASVFLWRLL